MEDEELRVRLAKLIVVALGVGTAKNDFEVINEIFGSFGASLPDSSNHFPSSLLRTGGEAYRTRVAKSLSDAAPTAGDLLNELVRVGGRLIDMVNEVYERLARHVANIDGARAEKFRFRRGTINEEPLTINPAFIEHALKLQRSIRAVKTGEIDEDALNSFLLWDNSFYGSWPPKSGQPLAALMLSRNRARAVDFDPTLASERKLIAAAESLVRVRIARLRMPLTAAEEGNGPSNTSTLASDYELISEVGLIGITVFPGAVTGVDRTSVIGLRADLTPDVVPVPDGRRHRITPLGMLAALVAMWHLDLRPEGDQERLAEYITTGERIDEAQVEQFRTSFDRAAEWLTHEVFTTISETDVMKLVEVIIEFLNLPLWKQRDFLYEIWILCATLDACEQADWTVELNGLSQDNREWVLSVGRSDTPVATLRHLRDSAVSLEVWREPSRKTWDAKELTPDVTVSTPAPYVRDLLVVEAKDRQRMRVGLGPRHDRTGPGVSKQTAIGVAERYAKGLRPRAVWVCNHCDFRQDISAEANYGNAWTYIHIADQFRPGNVPGAFARSVRAALAPDHDVSPTDHAPWSTQEGLSSSST